MQKLFHRLSIAFTGGCLGALVNSWVVWYLGAHGISHHLGIAIAPVWSRSYLYPRLVWGGLWGLLFLLPIWRNGFWNAVFSRGILFSFVPTAFQLLYVFPVQAHKGLLGLHLGHLTPLLVVFANVVWGWVTAAWVHWAHG